MTFLSLEPGFIRTVVSGFGPLVDDEQRGLT
jgi:hypothetical protein